MNTTLETRSSRDLTTAHPPQPELAPDTLAARPAPVRLLDRLALRVGLALIVWSRRTAPRPSRERLVRAHELHEQLAWERRQAERRRLTLAPRL